MTRRRSTSRCSSGFATSPRSSAEGGVDSESTVLIDKKGEAIVGNAPSIGFSIATGDSPFNPLRLVRGEWPGANEIVIDESTAKKKKFAIGEPIRVQAEGPIQSFTISGVIRFGETLSTIGDATLAGFDLPTAQRPLRKAGTPRRDRDRLAAGHLARSAPRRAPRGPAPYGASADRPGAGGRGGVGDERVHHVPPGLPARLRGDRAFRRQLRDRELALDHRRAAHPRVRDRADDRRLTPAGAWLRDAGGASRRDDRIGHGPLPRPRARRGPVRGLRGLRLHPAEHGAALQAAYGRRRDPRRRDRHLAREPAPGLRATRVPPLAAVREGGTLPPSRWARFRTPGSIVLTALGFAALSYGLFAPTSARRSCSPGWGSAHC